MLFLFIRLFIFLSFINVSYAAQWAKVTNDKAVIYADQQQLAPIGYIKKGKKVRVGEVVRNNGKLLPIVINGKVAYIKVEDLDISYSQKVLESPSQRLVKKATEKTSESRFALTYNGLATSLDTTDGEEFVFFNGGGVRSYFTNLKKKTTWRVGLDFITTTVNNYTLDVSSLSAEFSYNLIQTSFYDFHIYGGGAIIPYAQFGRDSDFKENGYGAGASAGVEMIFKLGDSLGIHVDGHYQYTQMFFQLDEIVQRDLNVTSFEPTLHGLKFSAALSFAY